MAFIAFIAIISQLAITRIWQSVVISVILMGILYINTFTGRALTSNPFFWAGLVLWACVWLVWFEQYPARQAKAEAKEQAEKEKQAAAANEKTKSKTEQAEPANQPSNTETEWASKAPAFTLNAAQELKALLTLDNGNYLASPKLDGIFARWIPNKGLFTKNGRRITCLAHIEQQLNQGETANHIIDGEIYSQAIAFELINGLVRCELARPEHSKLSFNAFDLPEHNGDHATRQQLLSKIITASDAVNLISTQLINAGQAGERYQHFLNQGYEGLILRCMQSLNVYKHKPLQDTEARLVGFTPAKNDKQPFNGLVLQMPSGKTFVISNLKKAQRELLWQQGANGQLITYSYQQLTAKGLPRFARFKALRHDMIAN